MTDDYFMRHAITSAMYSADPSTQNGAIVVDCGGVVVGCGWNSLPDGLAGKPERWEHPAKSYYVEHAERFAIYDGIGSQMDGGTMFCPWAACPDCARAIIAVGIKRLVVHAVPERLTPERWREGIAVANAMLTEAGVRREVMETRFGVRLRFDGREVEL